VLIALAAAEVDVKDEEDDEEDEVAVAEATWPLTSTYFPIAPCLSRA
jgi:hypothetical protein